MADIQNVTEVNGTATEKQEKTFSQEEVNSIIQNRIAEVKSKFADYDSLKEKASKFDEIKEAGKSELQKAQEKNVELQKQIDSMNREKEVNEIRLKVSKDTNVPIHLLNGSTEDECTAQAQAILSFANQNSQNPYPTVKDSGESNKTQKKTAVDQFAEWFNAQ